jgi:thiol:disulfide interchange protein
MLTDFLLNLEETFIASPVLGLGASFLAGLLVSFSPCIYPLIPITLGVVGATSVSSRRRAFLISTVFVLGIAFTYTVLGVLAAGLGVFLAKFFINPLTYFCLAVIFLVLGLALFDLIKVNIFSPSVSFKRKGGWASLFVMGAISGLAIIPCNFPVLGAILSLISRGGNIVYGAAALFLFSLGYGVLLIVLGTSTSLLRKLPKSGYWLIIIKKLLGVILILVAAYFLVKFIILIRAQ